MSVPLEQMIVFVTVGNQAEAKEISKRLVDQRLAACVTMIPQESVYRWRGKLTEDSEILLTIKTVRRHFQKVRDMVLAMHSYELPEIIGINLNEGYEAYLNWITQSVTQSK
jgi:periplasmic divalent cation tolerance protein